MFSETELSLLSDPDVMLLKLDIFKKLDMLFSEVQTELKSLLSDYALSFPREMNLERGKISKGENYKGLPWMMFDFPAFFSKSDSFAIRTFCWWGNHFSCSILIGGKFLQHYKMPLLSMANSSGGLAFIFHPDPWMHDINPGDIRLFLQVNKEDLLRQMNENGFIKLYSSWPLNKASELPALVKHFVLNAGLYSGFLSR